MIAPQTLSPFGNRSGLRFHILFVLFMAASLVYSADVYAQGDAEKEKDAQLDARIQRLQKEKQAADLEAEVIAAKRKALLAGLPAAESKALEGKLEIAVDRSSKSGDSLPIESESLSYKALADIGADIGADIKSKIGSGQRTFVILSAGDNEALLYYRLFTSQASTMIDNYEALLLTGISKGATDKSPVTRNLTALTGVLSAPEIATSLLKSTADLLAMFRTDTQIKEMKVDINESSLVALVADQLRRDNAQARVIYQAVYTPWQTPVNPEDPLAVFNQLNRLDYYRTFARVVVAEYEAKSDAAKKADPYAPRVVAIRSLNEQVDGMVKGLATEDRKGTNGLTYLIRAENLDKLLKKENTSALYVKVIQAGGSQRISKNLMLGTKLRYSGSAIVEYMLFDADGAILSSKTLYSHTGFTKIDPSDDRNRANNLGAPPPSKNASNQ